MVEIINLPQAAEDLFYYFPEEYLNEETHLQYRF